MTKRLCPERGDGRGSTTAQTNCTKRLLSIFAKFMCDRRKIFLACNATASLIFIFRAVFILMLEKEETTLLSEDVDSQPI